MRIDISEQQKPWIDADESLIRKVRLQLRAQPVDATHALNRSAGVSYYRVLRGRSFNWRATALSFAWECTHKSVPLEKYCLNRRLLFSLGLRCQGFHSPAQCTPMNLQLFLWCIGIYATFCVSDKVLHRPVEAATLLRPSFPCWLVVYFSPSIAI